MKIKTIFQTINLILAAAMLLSGCSGGGGGGGDTPSTPPPTYTIGGVVTGLAPGKSVVLQNNNGDDLSVSANGAFTFATALGTGSTYNVSVKNQPAGQTCTASTNSGTLAGASISDVTVTCATTAYSVGGSISNLKGTVVLQNNAGDDLTLSADGPFTFATLVANGAGYKVTVKTQPVAQICTATTNNGTIAGAAVTNVSVTCETAYSVGGTVSGLSGTVVLQDNGGDDLAVSANGSFTFATWLVNNAGYNVTVKKHPAGQLCVASTNSGNVSAANITTIGVTCVSAYTIGGSVTGLNGTLVLQNNNGDDLTMTAAGSFTFATPLAASSPGYSVTIKTQPVGQTCVASGSSGTASADITNVSIACTTNTYTLGGALSGLTGTVVLQNNGGDDLTLSANGNFTFATQVAYNTPYNVTVKTHPVGQRCTATNSSGTMGLANVTAVSVTCVNAYTISGSVSGLTGTGLVLQNSGGDDLAITANGSFTFPTIAQGYDVTIKSEPSGQQCSILSGSGTATAPVTNITVGCFVETVLDANPLSSKVTLSWNDDGASSHDLYYATDAQCDIANIYSCAGGTLIAAVTSPREITGLSNGHNYTYWLKANRTGGHATIAKTGARPDKIIVDDYVNTIATGADGTAYFGGNFSRVGARAGSGVPLYRKSNGTAPFAVVEGTVRAAVSDGAGGWYIGGSFTKVGSEARYNLAHILADGSVGAWNPSANSKVSALAIKDNIVYVGGDFYQIAGEYLGGVAALDATTGTRVPGWGNSMNMANNVNSLVVSGDTLYVGGRYSALGQQPRNNIGSLDAATGLVTSWNPDIDGEVDAIAVTGDRIYVGGIFTTIGGQPRNRIGAIDTSGNVTLWDPNATCSTYTSNYNCGVYALVVSGTTVYAGGSFISIGGQSRKYIAALDTGVATNNATALDPSANNVVRSLAVDGSNLIVGGEFTTIGGQSRGLVAKLDATSGSATAWNPNLGGVSSTTITSSDTGVFVLAQAADNTIYAGGEFALLGGEARTNLAAVDANGSLTGWKPTGSWPSSLLVDGSTVYIGDSGLRAVDSSSGANTGWKADVYGVYSLVKNGTVLYAGGFFTSVGGVTRNGLAAFDTTFNTNNLYPWDPNVQRDNSSYPYVVSLALSGSTLYVGGLFDTIGGQTRHNLAAVDTGTGLVSSWDPSPLNTADPTRSNVQALLLSGGTLYVGGEFDTIGGQTRHSLAAVDTGTGLATTWNPSPDYGVRAFALSGNTMYVGGGFTTIGGLSRYGLAAFDLTSGDVTAWNPSSRKYTSTSALALSGATVYAGSYLFNVDGTFARGIVAIPQ